MFLPSEFERRDKPSNQILREVRPDLLVKHLCYVVIDQNIYDPKKKKACLKLGILLFILSNGHQHGGNYCTITQFSESLGVGWQDLLCWCLKGTRKLQKEKLEARMRFT